MAIKIDEKSNKSAATKPAEGMTIKGMVVFKLFFKPSNAEMSYEGHRKRSQVQCR